VPLDPGYRELLEALVAVAKPDDRIRAVWLGGSIARGLADAGSDLDVILAVREDARADFEAGWREWLDSVAPILLAEQVPGVHGIVAATTFDCLRLDLVIESVGELAQTPYRTRLAVFDRDGLTARIPDAEPEPGPDRDRILALVGEFYRQQAIFPAAVVAREDWLLGVVAVHEMQRLLFQVFVACNAPLPPMGVKQWSSRLTAEQRRVLSELRQPTATSAEVVAAMLDVRGAFREYGRRLTASVGVDWPDDVDAAVTAYWRRVGLID
jgi:nucleotidyltransferase-like protein